MDGRDGVALKIGDEWELRFERRLKHPAHKVWNAIVGPGQMSRWFDETHFPQLLAVGGVIRFYHAVLDSWSEGEITALSPPHLIEWLWRGGFGPANRICWQITDAPGGSVLTLRQQITDPAILGRTLAGWHLCLDKLAAVIDGADKTDGPSLWRSMFEGYSAELKAAGVTTPQLGAPPKPPPKP